ncbi:unnamed protein product [Phaedon cochleariae]|uniref:Chitin-binding type-2 domain-containing protein n=1 Tax=Phaedon cochleariae TaxID=80249 RepID=A0A9P0D7V5_PHACE|nr:unnamed protein product [Phaedon cochleariae]
MLTVAIIFTFLSSFNFIDGLNLDSATEICKNTSVRCLSNNTYITCANAGAFTVLLNTQLTCPDGYICNESVLSHPCTKEGDTDSSSKNTETTTESTTRADSTTSQTDPTPPAACTSAGKYPSKNCNEYYECLKVMWWYRLMFRKCDESERFDHITLQCVPDIMCF